jgi:hypothetical protein
MFLTAERRVVDKDVDAAELFQRCIGEGAGGLVIPYVADNGRRLAATFSISPTTASASALFDRTFTMTEAPASASASAIARPILRPAPVTMATLPESSRSFISVSNCHARNGDKSILPS